MRDKSFLRTRAFPTIILIVGIIVGIAFYINHNLKMTLARNANYVADSAIQTAKRIDDLLVEAENSISAIAQLYERTMDPEQVDIEMLEVLTEKTPFDYMGIVGTDGIYTDNHGNQASVSDRDYYKDAMQGNAGMDVIFDSRITHENLVIFYAPLMYEGDVVGILTGRYREYQMKEIVKSTFFGELAKTYLCLPSGKVIVSSTDEEPVENIIEMFAKRQDADRAALEKIQTALPQGDSCSLTFNNAIGSSAAYLTKLPGNDWMLLQVFPIKVTNEMLAESNSATIYLELWLVGIFICYIIALLLDNHRQKKRLTTEKEEMEAVVQKTSQLFSRFVLIDFKLGSYSYFNNDDPYSGKHLLQKGSYSDFRKFWHDRFVNDEDESVREKLTPEYIQEHLTEDTPYLQFEYQIMEESVRWKQISVLCLKREDGVPTSVLMAIQDVTELKEMEMRNRTALEEAYHAAQAANKAKSNFLFNMSHDMRTPLNAIIGFCLLLDRDCECPEKVREYHQKISASGQQLLSLVNDVLNMTKNESGETTLNLTQFTIAELLEELNAQTKPQIMQKEQILDIKVRDLEKECLLGDRVRLVEILVNLMSNAIKYTPRGGHIELAIQKLPELSRDHIHLCFQVSDNGIGMTQEFLEHIYDPFTRERNSTTSGIPGTGLGMAITKNLVELMGGTISGESIQGKGSTFRVELQLRCAKEDKKEISQSPVENTGDEEASSGIQSMLEGRRILVVEDNDINAEIVMDLLSFEGVSSERAVNGKEAVSLFESNAPHYFDAVLMDIQMPVMNGYEATRAIRALNRPDAMKIPIVAMTANAFPDDIQKSLESGMNAHVAKPVDMEVLQSTLETLIL